jgi:DNA-binding winged helix-turn-helix (wHTH) protein
MSLRFAPFTLDIDRRQLVRGSDPVHLSPKAFELLCCLAEKRPNAVSKSELYERIWPGTFVVDANLTVLIAEVRRALGDDPQTPQFIRTVPKFGYAFCADAGAIGDPVNSIRVGLTWADRVIWLERRDTVIGRDPSCDIWLDRRGVSRLHARVVREGGQTTIEDLGSKNGTFVGTSRVLEPRVLADGDVIHIGSAELGFRIWAPDRVVETERIARESE